MLVVGRLGPRSARPHFVLEPQIVERFSMLFLDSSTRLVPSLLVQIFLSTRFDRNRCSECLSQPTVDVANATDN